MSSVPTFGPERLQELLSALGAQLQALGVRIELVVAGGAALQALGLVGRATRDVDVLALFQKGEFASATPLPEGLAEARSRVARDFALPPDWLNPGPTDLTRFGLPDGFADRLETRKFGRALTVHFVGRLDQIHFKLYAFVDQGAGRHEADLRVLEPSVDELLAAARWTLTQDPSEGFRATLLQALQHLGVLDAEQRL